MNKIKEYMKINNLGVPKDVKLSTLLYEFWTFYNDFLE